MKKANKYFAIFFFAIIPFVGCTPDDILTKTPLDTFSEDVVWSDINSINAYANSMYVVFPSAQHLFSQLTNRSWALSAASDEAYNKFNDYNLERVNLGEITPDNMGNFSIWSITFSTIQNCNVFLSRIDAVTTDEALRDQLKGEVQFIRAYAYFKLIRDYGGVPIITAPFSLESNFTLTRNTFDECVAFIASELDNAIPLLPNAATATLGRATKGAAMALKSTVLLYSASPFWNPSNNVQRWQLASDAAKAIIDAGEYQLYNGKYENLFTSQNTEQIFIRSTQKKDLWSSFQGVEMFLSPNGFHGWSSFAPSQRLVDDFDMANGKAITDPTSGYNQNAPYTGREYRFQANIIFDGRPYGKPEYFKDRYASGGTNKAEFFEGGLDSDKGFDTWNASKTRYAFRKYCDTTFNFNQETQTDKFWIISRLGEIYLNYAEAQFRLGNEQIALEYLNKIRRRAGIKNDLVGISGNDLQNRIYKERSIELCLEGHRYYDVRRWRIAEVTENKPLEGMRIEKGFTGKTYTKFIVQNRKFLLQHYLLPIPQSEIQRIKLDQNPGY